LLIILTGDFAGLQNIATVQTAIISALPVFKAIPLYKDFLHNLNANNTAI
jgi:hypothetical protein